MVWKCGSPLGHSLKIMVDLSIPLVPTIVPYIIYRYGVYKENGTVEFLKSNPVDSKSRKRETTVSYSRVKSRLGRGIRLCQCQNACHESWILSTTRQSVLIYRST